MALHLKIILALLFVFPVKGYSLLFKFNGCSSLSPILAVTEIHDIQALPTPVDGRTHYAFGHLHKADPSDHTVATIAAFGDMDDLDLLFGTDGIVQLETPNGMDSTFFSGAIQQDGKILAAGTYNTTINNSQFLIARYLPDGNLDSTFGSAGVLLINPSNLIDVFFSIVVQPDGKILAAGIAKNYDDWYLTRLNDDGTPDPSFGTAGVVKRTDGFGNNYTGARQVILQPDGKILLVGTVLVATSTFEISAQVVRYNNDGSPDTSFGMAGVVTIPHETNKKEYFPSAVVQKNGRIVVGMTSNFLFREQETSQGSFYLVRLHENGVIDPMFNAGAGKAVVHVSTAADGYNDIMYKLAIDSEDRVLAAGTAGQGPTKLGNFLLMRFKDGTLDSEFGNLGITQVEPQENAAIEYCMAMQIMPDTGKILLGGTSLDSNLTGSWLTYRFWP